MKILKHGCKIKKYKRIVICPRCHCEFIVNKKKDKGDTYKVDGEKYTEFKCPKKFCKGWVTVDWCDDAW